MFGQVVFTILVMQPSKEMPLKENTMGRNWLEKRKIFQRCFLWEKRANDTLPEKITGTGNELMRILTMDRRLLLGILYSFYGSFIFRGFSKVCGLLTDSVMYKGHNQTRLVDRGKGKVRIQES